MVCRLPFCHASAEILRVSLDFSYWLGLKISPSFVDVDVAPISQFQVGVTVGVLRKNIPRMLCSLFGLRQAFGVPFNPEPSFSEFTTCGMFCWIASFIMSFTISRWASTVDLHHSRRH